MYEINAYDMEFERCDKNKEPINIVLPYAVLHFVLDGEGYVNGNKITKNIVFISGKEALVNYYPSKSNPWTYVYVRLKGVDIKKAFADYGFDAGVTIKPFYRKKELFDILRLYNSLDKNNSEAEIIIANALFLLFDKNSDKPDIASTRLRNAEKVKDFIDENYHKKITVKSIANKMFLSKDYIRNLFSEFYGISPKGYIQDIRMTRAKELLQKTNISIATISSSVGYDDALLFSKMFKKYYGISPKNYRNRSKI